MKNSSRAAKGTVFHIYLSRQKRHGVFAKKGRQDIHRERRTVNMMNGIIEIDVHGKNVESAIEEIRKHMNNAKPSVYRIRIIHGYHGGTEYGEGIREEFSYGREPRVKRITMGDNQGITELVLREF